MIELVAACYVLSVLTMILAQRKGGTSMLDPWAAKMISIYMLSILLSLVFISSLIRGV